MSKEYDNYILEHKEALMHGLEWMQQNLPSTLIDGEKMVEAMANAEIHDQSKWSAEEYDAYDAYFYGDIQRPPEVQSAFDRAWLHHIHLNPHHWQHWVLLEDDPNLGSFGKVLDMPLEYIYEMIADWWTFSWRNNHLMEIFDWYTAHQNNIRLSLKTRMIVEGILSQIFKVLNMQMILAGKSDEVKTYIFIDENLDNLSHSGTKGQKWGIRNYQNLDGTWTELGKERRRKTVFISGSSKTQSEDSEYYRKELPKEIKRELKDHIKNGDKILVGDAPGIDRQVQDYLKKKNYGDVEVYGPGKRVRYSADEKWKTHPVDAPEFEEGSKEWLAKKDKAMADAADEGLAIVIPNGASATRKNVDRLLADNKDVLLFELNVNGKDRWIPVKPEDYISHGEELDEEEVKRRKYAFPEERKFPMPDAKHVKSAIRFFNYVDPKDEETLANYILARMKEYGMKLEDLNVGDENRFKKYLPKDEVGHDDMSMYERGEGGIPQM